MVGRSSYLGNMVLAFQDAQTWGKGTQSLNLVMLSPNNILSQRVLQARPGASCWRVLVRSGASQHIPVRPSCVLARSGVSQTTHQYETIVRPM